jgi:hypothetical protein
VNLVLKSIPNQTKSYPSDPSWQVNLVLKSIPNQTKSYPSDPSWKVNLVLKSIPNQTKSYPSDPSWQVNLVLKSTPNQTKSYWIKVNSPNISKRLRSLNILACICFVVLLDSNIKQMSSVYKAKFIEELL